MHTIEQKLHFIDRLSESAKTDDEKEILSEISDDIANFSAVFADLNATRKQLRDTEEKINSQNEKTKQLIMLFLKDSGVYDAIIEDAKRAAESAASSECCRLSGINL